MTALKALIDSSRVVDLTHALTPDFPLFPVYDPVTVAEKFAVASAGFYDQRWCLDEHVGTHVDAPAHFGGDATMDEVDPADLLLELAVIDIRERAARDPDAVVGPDDIRAWESRHGRLPDRSAVVAFSGWEERAGDTQSFLNVDSDGTMHFPAFGGEAAAFLLEERPEVRAIGVDVPSLDAGRSTDYPVHSSWLPSGRLGIENLARLADVPPRGALIFLGAPPLARGSAAPARILALVP